jgi:Resolvase, N terminal domain
MNTGAWLGRKTRSPHDPPVPRLYLIKDLIRYRPPTLKPPLGACQQPRKGRVSVRRRAARLNQDAAGPILVTVLGMVAEMECTFIRKRRQAGIQAAKAMGI